MGNCAVRFIECGKDGKVHRLATERGLADDFSSTEARTLCGKTVRGTLEANPFLDEQPCRKCRRRYAKTHG